MTENIANEGKRVAVCYEMLSHLDDGVLPYPNAKLQSVKLDFGVTFVKPNVVVDGTITCVVEGICDRCANSVVKSIKLPFNQTFYKDGAEGVDAYAYYDSKLDATKAVYDEIVLSLPSSLLCKESCKGLCPKCATNLNERQCDCDTTRENAFSVLKDLKF